MSRQYTAISLFSGAMGLDLGIHQTGRFRLLACVEKEKSFCDSIRANQRAGRIDTELAVLEADIRDLDPADVLTRVGLKQGELDLLIGGPPCQSFSTAGRRAGILDPRGTLLWEFLRFVAHMKPKMFLMENVRGLVSASLAHRRIADRPEKGGASLAPEEQQGTVIQLLARDLQKIDGCQYHMDCFEVNAVNYGAPQLRERALFIGNRYGVQVDFPNPTHGHTPQHVRQPDDLFARATPLRPWRTLRDAIGSLPDDSAEIMDFSPRKKAYLTLVPAGSNWRSLPSEIQKKSMGSAWHAKGGRSGWWRRLSFDLPCPTLITMPNHASTSLCHPSEVRALSLREYASIQEFPTDWEFSGTTAQKYAQVGNAVPVRLGVVAGEVLAQSLDRLEGRGAPLPLAPDAYRVIYIQAHVRTRQWFKNGETFVWRDGRDNADALYGTPQTLRRVSTFHTT
ncbi:MAG: DNA cytosine methyltransferase [Bauldia sp.]